MNIGRILKISGYLFLAIILLLVLVLTGINLPFGQHLVSEKVNNYFRQNNLPVRADKITLLLNGKLSLINPMITTDPGDTIVFAHQIKASVRILPLLFKEVIVNDINIDNALVNLRTDSVTGSLNLVSIFSKQSDSANINESSVRNDALVENEKYSKNEKSGDNDQSWENEKSVKNIEPGKEKKPGRKEKTGRKWDVNVSAINLENIRLVYDDRFNGILINQSIRKFSIRFDRFSLINQQLYAAFLDLEKADGSIVLTPSSHSNNRINKAAPAWIFKLSQSDLKGIRFTLHQPDENSRIEVTMDRGKISEAGFELAGKRISANSIILYDPGVFIFSSPSPAGQESGNDNLSGIAFPGPWAFSVNNVEIVNGSCHTSDYSDGNSRQGADNSFLIAGYDPSNSGYGPGNSGYDPGNSGLHNKNNLFQVKTLSMVMKDLLLSHRESGFKMNSLSFGLENGFQLDKGEMVFRSDSDANIRLTANLRTSSSSLNLTLNAGSGPFTLIKSYHDVPFSVKLEGTEISKTDLIHLLPQLKEKYTMSTLQNFSLGINCDASGTLDSLEIGKIILNSSDGSELFVSGSVTNLTKPESSVCSFTFKTDTISRSRLNEMLQLTGSNLNLPDFEPLKINGSISDSVFKPDLSFELKSLSGNIALNGSINLPEKGYDLEMDYSGLDLGNLADISEMGKLSGSINLSGKGFLPETMKVTSDVVIDSAEYKGYNYHCLIAELEGEKGFYNWALNSSDPSFECNLIGNIDFKDSLKRGNISGKIKVDADKLNLTRGIGLSCELAGDLNYMQDNLNTSLSLKNFVLKNENKSENIENLFLNLQLSDSLVKGDIRTDFLTADFYSGCSVNELIQVFKDGRPRGFSIIDSAAQNNFPYVSLLPELHLFLESNYDPFIGLLLPDSVFSFNKVSLNLGKDTTGHGKADITIDRFNIGPGNGFSTTVNLESSPEQSHLSINADSMRYASISVMHPGIEITSTDDTTLFRINSTDKNEQILYDLAGSIYKNGPGIHMEIHQMNMSEGFPGSMKISGNWLQDNNGIIVSDLRAIFNDTSSVSLNFLYDKKSGKKSFNTNFSGIPLNSLEALASKYIRGLQGEISGGLLLTSDGNKPELNGKLEISRTSLTVIPLNTRYYLSDNVIKLENNQLLFNQFAAMDSLKKQLILNGIIDLNDRSNITADLRVTSDHIQVMNTTGKDNQVFNGSIFVDSKLNITGPIAKPSIAGNILLAKGTVINYRYTENLNVSEAEKTIHFTRLIQDQPSAETSPAALNTVSNSPNIKALIEIDPNSLFNFEISSGYDISVNITGGGFLNYAMMPNRTINLNGIYEINQGNAVLKIPGWPRKDFIITPGSTLKWDGSVDNPELNVETTSKVRGSYYNRVEGKNREVDFKVYMKLANRLSQLDIIFDVRSEDQYIMSILNSLSTEERMRQAINLLIFNQVDLPDVTSSSNYIYDQINSFWESQLNQLTKSTFKSVELSVGIDTYTDVSKGGSEQEYTSFTYEVKKEMFKNRGSVLVSGRMNDNSPAGSQNDNVIENFIFEYSLDPNRTKYLKVYRQQNWEDLLEGEVTKSGVGFIYRKNYNKLRDIWRIKKKTNKNRQELLND